MIKKLLLAFLFVFQFSNSQNTVGTISISEDVYDAYTLITIHTKTYLINNCGEIINEWTSNYLPGNSVYLLPNGNILRAGRLADGSTTVNIGGIGGIVELFDWDNNLLWSYTYSNALASQHHDVYPLPNGNILMLAITIMSNAEAIEAGRNPLFLLDNELYNEQIIELEPVGTDQANIVWQWDIKDHLIQDFNNTKSNFGVVENNPQRLDINFLNDGAGAKNWIHINSIQYDETLDQIILSSRNLSEIWIIDHSTTTAEAASNTGGIYGKGGDFLYRWGNPEAYRQGTSSDRTLFGQHYPHYIESGLPNERKIIIFNNGINRTPSFSQIDIITPPESSLGVYDYTSNTAYGPLNTDYTYTDFSEDPSPFYSSLVGSAQQLPNGNILICEGRFGEIFEIDTNDTIVWYYVNPISNVNGETTSQTNTPPNINLTFRAIKYNLDYPAFIGRDLTPNGTLETNPNLAPCNNLSIEDSEKALVSIYPNPTKNKIEINTISTIDKVEIYNILGNKIYETKSSIIDLSNQTNGIYFLRIYSNARITSRKIIKN